MKTQKNKINPFCVWLKDTYLNEKAIETYGEFNLYKILIDDILQDSNFPLEDNRQIIIDYLCKVANKSLDYMNCFECVWEKYSNRNKKYLRKTCDIAVEDTIKRIQIANKSKDFIYKVKKIVLFGSYINSNKEKIGDVDIAIYLELKNKEKSEIEQNISRSYTYEHYIFYYDRLSYGKEEVIKFIRNRKRVLHIHNGDYVEREAKIHNVPIYIYQNKYKELLF